QREEFLRRTRRARRIFVHLLFDGAGAATGRNYPALANDLPRATAGTGRRGASLRNRAPASNPPPSGTLLPRVHDDPAGSGSALGPGPAPRRAPGGDGARRRGGEPGPHGRLPRRPRRLADPGAGRQPLRLPDTGGDACLRARRPHGHRRRDRPGPRPPRPPREGAFHLPARRGVVPRGRPHPGSRRGDRRAVGDRRLPRRPHPPRRPGGPAHGSRDRLGGPLPTVVGRVQGGVAFNVIPTSVELGGTVRTLDPELWSEIPMLLESLASQIVAPIGAKATVSHQTGIPPVVNDPGVIDVARVAIAEALGPQAVTSTDTSMGAEDFSRYLEHVPGALLRLGSAPDHGMSDLHSAGFVFNEAALDTGLVAGAATLLRLLAAG